MEIDDKSDNVTNSEQYYSLTVHKCSANVTLGFLLYNYIMYIVFCIPRVDEVNFICLEPQTVHSWTCSYLTGPEPSQSLRLHSFHKQNYLAVRHSIQLG